MDPQILGQGARIIDGSLRGIGPGHPDADHIFRTDGIGGNDSGQGGVDTAAQTDDGFQKTALLYVIACAQDESGIYARFFAGHLLVDFAGQVLRVEVDEIFFEGATLGDHLSFTIKHQAGTVEHETVVASDLVDENHWNLVLARNAGQHVAAKFALANPERRGGNIENEVPACPNEGFDRIDRIHLFGPETFVVPGIFANGQRHAIATERKQFLTFGGSEVAHLVEDVVGGEQHLRLEEGHLAVHEEGGGIHNCLAAVGVGGRDQTTDHGDSLSLGG